MDGVRKFIGVCYPYIFIPDGISGRVFLQVDDGCFYSVCKSLAQPVYFSSFIPEFSFFKILCSFKLDNGFIVPYNELEQRNRLRGENEDEYEINDTGVFNDGCYFDVFIEYAKNNEEDICIKISVHNRSEQIAPITVLPTLWLRNLWSYGLIKEKPVIELMEQNTSIGEVKINGIKMGEYSFYCETPERILFTENETNTQRLYNVPNKDPYVKDAFHEAVTANDFQIFEDKKSGTKCAPVYSFEVEAQSAVTIQCRLSKQPLEDPLGISYDETFTRRLQEADEFYDQLITCQDNDLKNIQRQAYAGMSMIKIIAA